ncbi:tetratricopeptide repeat protein [Microbacterium sp. SSM24]|uniref:tetratricopeptide repeat protein n=1 Tax=Microbacterium sp. SSM24 TaxID=2991714 RepID=UPI002227D8F2|nr:hypothetical protein [Microbacterium sp. SSM24]MCW3492388.1 hypothetical protein [Microbacterium sp. SSM24]
MTSRSFADAMARGDYDDAIELLRRSDSRSGVGLDEAPYVLSVDQIDTVLQAATRDQALYNLGVAVWGLDGQELEALTIFSVAATAGSPDAAAAVGEALAWFGLPELAVQWIRPDDFTGDHRAWLSGILGESLLETDEPAYALKLLATAFSSHHEFGVAYGKALRVNGDVGTAQSLLRQLVRAGAYGAAIQLGILEEEAAGDLAAAEDAYREGVETGDAHAAYNLGLLLLRQDRIDESNAAFLQARALGDPTPPPIAET